MPLPGVLKAVWHHQNDEDRPRSYRIEGLSDEDLCQDTGRLSLRSHLRRAPTLPARHGLWPLRPRKLPKISPAQCPARLTRPAADIRVRPTRRAGPSPHATTPARTSSVTSGSVPPTEASTRLTTSFVTGSKLRVRWWCVPGLAGPCAFDDPLNSLVGGVADFGGTAIGVRPRGSRKDAPIFALQHGASGAVR